MITIFFFVDLIGPRELTILVIMTTVSISELKANLSRYVRQVRRGGEVHYVGVDPD